MIKYDDVHIEDTKFHKKGEDQSFDSNGPYKQLDLKRKNQYQQGELKQIDLSKKLNQPFKQADLRKKLNQTVMQADLRKKLNSLLRASIRKKYTDKSNSKTNSKQRIDMISSAVTPSQISDKSNQPTIPILDRKNSSVDKDIDEYLRHLQNKSQTQMPINDGKRS